MGDKKDKIEKTIFYEDEINKYQKRLVKMFPKYYKIKKSPEQKAENKKLKEEKKDKKLIKELDKEHNAHEKYYGEFNKRRGYINSLKSTHMFNDPLQRALKISREIDSESELQEILSKYSDTDFDTNFNMEKYRRRPGGIALMKQIEMELQSRTTSDHKKYNDDILIKKYKKRKKKKKDKKRDIESILD